MQKRNEEKEEVITKECQTFLYDNHKKKPSLFLVF